MNPTKRAGVLVMVAVVAMSVFVLALSATGTHDQTLVAFRQASQAEPEAPRPHRNETVERRPRSIRENPRDQDQLLMLLLLLETGSPASRR